MSTRAVFDTSVLIDSDGADRGRIPNVTAVVTAVTVAELAYGLDTRDPVERHMRQQRLDSIVDTVEILPFDTEAAKLYGVLCSLVRQIGRDPRPRRMDMQIAATAARHSLPLITRNGKDFAGLGRVLEVVEV